MGSKDVDVTHDQYTVHAWDNQNRFLKAYLSKGTAKGASVRTLSLHACDEAVGEDVWVFLTPEEIYDFVAWLRERCPDMRQRPATEGEGA